MNRTLFKILLGGLLAFMLTGCFGTPKISLEEANFDIMPPPSVNGVGRAVKSDSLTRILAGASYGISKRFAGRVKEGSINFPVEYELNSFGIFGDYRSVHSNEDRHHHGGGFGLYPYPYLYLFTSHGYEHAEVGLYALTSISIETVDYSGVAQDAPSTYKEYMMDDFPPEYTKVTKEYNVHGNGSAGLFLNIFVGNFTASYIPSIYFPWLYLDGFDNKKGYESSVWFPVLIIQEIQLAYNYLKWSFGASATNVVSDVLSDSYWKFGVNVSFYK